MPLDPAELALARRRPAAHHRRRISPSRHRVTRAVTRRVTERADSMGLVVANVRRNAPTRPSRTTVSVSSSLSRRLETASGLIRSSQRAVASSVVGRGVGCRRNPLLVALLLGPDRGRG